MKITELTQGSPEWHAHRAKHFNASDAPAMMGVSPYKTRTQLLDEYATGIRPEPTEAEQRLFDEGHRAEALCRPIAEDLIADELYPVTGSEGRLSASFDGLTIDNVTSWEHKSLNEALRAILPPTGIGDFACGQALPDVYRFQMEQQTALSECERTLFSASKWDREGNLIEARHCWYRSDPKLLAAVLAGWEQFAQDLKTHVPRKAADPKPMGRAPNSLPSLRVEVSGSVVASNLAEFKADALAAIAAVNRDLNTDADFADAETTVKWCTDIESRLKAAKEAALSQTADIDALFRTMDDISAEARKTRLDLTKLVQARKDEIKSKMVGEAKLKARDHVVHLESQIRPHALQVSQCDFGSVIKGKRTVDSIRDALDTALAGFKIQANEALMLALLNLQSLANMAPDRGHLFPDVEGWLHKPNDDFKALVAARLTAADQAEAKRKSDAEAKAQAEADAAAVKAVVAVVPTTSQGMSVVSFQRAAEPTNAKVAVDDPSEPAELKLGQVCERLGLTMSGDFVANTLGIQPAKQERRSILFREAQFNQICIALMNHVQRVMVKMEKAA